MSTAYRLIGFVSAGPLIFWGCFSLAGGPEGDFLSWATLLVAFVCLGIGTFLVYLSYWSLTVRLPPHILLAAVVTSTPVVLLSEAVFDTFNARKSAAIAAFILLLISYLYSAAGLVASVRQSGEQWLLKNPSLPSSDRHDRAMSRPALGDQAHYFVFLLRLVSFAAAVALVLVAWFYFLGASPYFTLNEHALYFSAASLFFVVPLLGVGTLLAHLGFSSLPVRPAPLIALAVTVTSILMLLLCQLVVGRTPPAVVLAAVAVSLGSYLCCGAYLIAVAWPWR